ncbi:MAG: cobalamin-dependent protein, partial [bacterium]
MLQAKILEQQKGEEKNIGCAPYRPKYHIRVVTATSLFDGHDAAINIIRRLLQATGAEVIHLGHNRSVEQIVNAAIEEDVQGVAVSSYQGGHIEFYKYMVDLLKEKGAPHIKVFGGGGGVIVPEEIKELEAYGVAKIYSPEDGTRLGLQGIINHMMKILDFSTLENDPFSFDRLSCKNKGMVARMITRMEEAKAQGDGHLADLRSGLSKKTGDRKTPVLGITGTGGSGKSSLIDELIVRLLRDHRDIRVAIISCDPSRRKTGGALLGDRIRMNALGNSRVYMRSLATRQSQTEISETLTEGIQVAKAAGFDLIIVETAGIGQGDSRIAALADVSIYVMTSEFGAASQLEKIDMLDFADLVVINKYDRQGSEDALREVRRQLQHNRNAWDHAPEEMPVFGTIASKFNDDGVTALYHSILDKIAEKCNVKLESGLPKSRTKTSTSKTIIIQPDRTRYLSEIADTIRKYHRHTEEQADAVRKVWHLEEALKSLSKDTSEVTQQLKNELAKAESLLDRETTDLLREWEEIRETYSKEELVYKVNDHEMRLPLYSESLSHQRIPKIALPGFKDPGEIYRWMREENVNGRFPYTSGVFPLKRVDEEPTRMFAGEGDPARTNRRFKLLSA